MVAAARSLAGTHRVCWCRGPTRRPGFSGQKPAPMVIAVFGPLVRAVRADAVLWQLRRRERGSLWPTRRRGLSALARRVPRCTPA